MKFKYLARVVYNLKRIPLNLANARLVGKKTYKIAQFNIQKIHFSDQMNPSHQRNKYVLKVLSFQLPAQDSFKFI